MMTLLLFLCFPANAADDAFFQDLENFRTQSLRVQSARQNLEASSDLLFSKNLFWTPRLSLSANQSKSQINQTVTDDRNYLAADLTWNLFRGGGDVDSLHQAKALNKFQQLQLVNEELRIEVGAADVIFKSIFLTETKRIQEEFLRMKEDSLKIVLDRYKQGKMPLQEVTKSEVDLVQQKSKARLAGLDILENKSQIANAFVKELKTKNWLFTADTRVDLQNKFKRPLTEQKYWMQQALEATWRASRATHWPSLDLKMQYQESPIKDRTERQWLGLLSLTLPIWSQFETTAMISADYAKYVNAKSEFTETETSVQQKILFLNEKIKISSLNLVEAQRNFDRSKNLYQNILRGYRSGRISTNDLMLDQNRLLDTANNLAASQLLFHQTLVESCVIVGLKTAECLK